jgi:hypothetical protein
MKRIIYSTGLKGGVAKTTTARNILDQHDELNSEYQAFDSDPTNSQLLRYYEKYNRTEFLNLMLVEEQAYFIDEILIAKKPPLIIIDLPAGGKEEMDDFENRYGLIANGGAEELGYRITQVWNLGITIDSIFGLEQLYDICGDKCDYILAKHAHLNNKGGYAYKNYDEAGIRKTMLERGAVEIIMPAMDASVYTFIDRQGMTFTEVAKRDSENIPFSIYLRAKSYRQAVKAAFSRAAFFLALSDVPNESTSVVDQENGSAKKRGRRKNDAATKAE